MPTADNGDVRLHYELSGQPDGEVLVLANSLGSSLHMWDKVAPALEKQYRLLRFDMRGHGRSSLAAPPYTMEQLGSDVLFLLDRIGAGRAHICGLSLGGMVAMWMGVHAPERARRLIFANTAAHIGTHEGWEQRIAAARTTGMGPLAELTLGRWFTPAYRERHPEEIEAVRAMIAATDPEGYAACCGVLRDTDMSGEIAAIAAPCLVIAGTHDPATPPSDGRALHSALRGSRYVELNASHLSAWECAEEFAGAVLSFLA